MDKENDIIGDNEFLKSLTSIEKYLKNKEMGRNEHEFLERVIGMKEFTIKEIFG